VKHTHTRIPWRAAGRTAALISILAFTLGSTPTSPYTSHEKAFFADPKLVQYVQPGLAITVTAAQIASDGTITATVSIADPAGQPLDRTGATTPGVVTLSLVAAVIPKGQEQYVSYTTRSRTGAVTGKTVIQAGADTGGTFTQVSSGVYTYKFATKAPSGFDASATHTIGVYGNRNLTAFSLGTNYASAAFNFVPNGNPVTVTRDVVRSSGCDTCHDQISFHGGSRRGVELCVLCHTPQTADPDTGLTVDFKVMVHKIHDGSSLPSVVAGGKYAINGGDWSTVVYPADVRRCETCHKQDSKIAQATAYMTKPSRDACGSCHDNLDFATGKNHLGGPQFDDKLCSTCHIPQGEYDFDASIKGGHAIPADSSLLGGLVVTLTKISNGTAGSKPVVAFTLKDGSGTPLPVSKVTSLSFTMGGPTTDYGTTNFGTDVTTPGYVTESATSAANLATCAADGTCLYTFLHAVPAAARGTFVIGVESRRSETVLPGTTKQQTISYGAKNQVLYFSVDGSKVAPRRSVVATANCNGCHVELSLHGGLRNQTEYCVLCHNPANTDIARRPTATVAADKALPPQGINFNLLVHRIHTGDNLPANRPYVVVGFGGTHNDFSDVRYPAMNAQGNPGDTRNCSICHVNSSQLTFPAGLNPVTDPQGPLNPVQPVTSACTGCHVDIATASHALTNTNQLGESCSVCHGAGADFAVDKEHAQY
jgi:OmcA/MtrC family decaheme c-type cytochrome